MKSMKSEDLSKDLQVNLRISPQTVKDFMMNWMNRVRNLEEKSNSDQQCIYGPDLCSDLCSDLRDPALRLNTLHLSRKWDSQRLCKRQPLIITLTLRQR